MLPIELLSQLKNDILNAYEADPSSKCKNVMNQTAASTKPDFSMCVSSQSIYMVTPGSSKQTFEDVMQFDPLAPSLPYQLQDGFKHLSSPPTSNPMPSLELQSMMLALLEDIKEGCEVYSLQRLTFTLREYF